MNSIPVAAKPHYMILDGLRGVAALMVVIFHFLEAHSTSHKDMMINHGYLAVDFFFLLSGFVIGYAYDDRWGKITIWEFFKRRIIRLQPMLVIGMIFGAIGFYFQDSVLWPNISEVPVTTLLLVMLVGCTLLPLPVSMDIRGWAEMHPLNGPAWSLFFEYVGNILYAIGIRKLPNTALFILVVIAGGALVHLAVTNPEGDVIGGWSLEPYQFYIGITRLMFPFFAGLLLSRTVKLTSINNAFLWCSLLLITAFSIPRIGGSENVVANGLYDSLTIILVFPVIIYLGASGHVHGQWSSRFCKFLGDISYPIYITHYPIIYIYTGWVQDSKAKIQDTYPIVVIGFLACVAIAYACLKLYDVPVRKWLSEKLIAKKTV